MARKAQRGFVLVAVLWILAVITIGAAYFAERVGRSIELARQKQEATEQVIEFANTRADLMFRLGTTAFSFHGLGEAPSAIVPDGRAYRGTGKDIVRLQDERGLLNVNFVERAMVTRFLEELGIPLERRDSMVDALLDYTDADDLRRLNGAEAAEYKALGLPLPPNELLVTPYQLKNLIGWHDQPALWENQRLLQYVTTTRISGFNPNTAPLELLASLPGSNREIAAALISARKEKPLYGVQQLKGFVGDVLDADYFLYFPGNSIRITHQSEKLPWAVQYSVRLTPRNESAPWSIDYYIKTAVSYPTENAEKIPKLPASAAAEPGNEKAL